MAQTCKVELFLKSLLPGFTVLMQGMGMLVLLWLIVLGCDAFSIVTELSKEVSNFKVGDKVFGCTVHTRQEAFLITNWLCNASSE